VADALSNATAISDGKLSKTLKKLLKKSVANQGEKLAVEDTQLGKIIKVILECKNRTNIKCVIGRITWK
jgi:nucleolar protein 58